ncbi:MAG: type I glutamate--ammonia ligase [Gemmatimonadota bacterium]|nr:MAG: type I glutamate--ammonia ligase [Gemmatimonadota bacterium]
MFTKAKEALEYIRREKVCAVDMKFTDLFGAWHHLTVPKGSVDDALFEAGIGFDGSSIPGFSKLESGDLVLLPDPATAFIDPFWENKTLSFICDIGEADSKERYHRDPRSVAQRAEEYLVKTGIATQSLWSPEFEYYIFDNVRHVNDTNRAFYEIDSEEASWNAPIRERPNLGHHIPPSGGYHVIPPMDTLYNLRAETVRLIEEVHIPVRYHHHEVGGPGQSEIEIGRGPLTKTADWSMIIKYFIKMTAKKFHKTATFMPKPLFGESGSGLHFHQQLFKNEVPIFHDEAGYAGLSRTALSYIAGVLTHGSALLAFTNPSTNSYKRLVPGFEAPVNLFFSLANRSASVRIPKYAIDPMEKTVEFRPPDATCNPYLAMSAILLAGIEGILKNLDPTAEGFGPIDENVFEWTEDERRTKIKPLSTSLKGALDHLKEDHRFLLEGKVFSADLIETWNKYKFEKEYQEVRSRPHPYEIALYYNV